MTQSNPSNSGADMARSIEQAVALQRAGRLDDAEKIYAQILRVMPDQFETLQLLAELNMMRGQLAEAQRLATAAVAARPQSADALVQLAFIQRTTGRSEDAFNTVDRALRLAPNNVDALGISGDLLLGQGRPEEALQRFDRILLQMPHPDARANRAVALAALGRFEEALKDCDAVLAVMPTHPMALYNRANVLVSQGRVADSLAGWDRFLALAPQHAQAWNNRGNTLTALKRHAEAVESFARAIALQPNYADAHFNQSLALLATGDYTRGFAAYEWRWLRSGMPPQRDYGKPLWRGETPVAGKTILIHSEQGLGDCIQFARYVPMLAKAGAQVILEVQTELQSLLSRLAGVAQVVARGDRLPEFDVHCPIGSLPRAYNTELSGVPSEIPYLAADENRVAKWRERVEAKKRPRVGLVWAGNTAHINDRNRSIPLEKLRPWLGTDAVCFVGLQRDPRDVDLQVMRGQPAILHLGSDIVDLDDTAAILALCDLTISVDTSVAHLSAAMGRPTWVLLPFSPDWRWTLQGERSPWYPAVRLFRQERLGDWHGVIGKVREALVAFAAQKH